MTTPMRADPSGCVAFIVELDFAHFPPADPRDQRRALRHVPGREHLAERDGPRVSPCVGVEDHAHDIAGRRRFGKSGRWMTLEALTAGAAAWADFTPSNAGSQGSKPP